MSYVMVREDEAQVVFVRKDDGEFDARSWVEAVVEERGLLRTSS